MIASLDYYVLPVLAAVLSSFLGHQARVMIRPLAACAGALVVLLVATGIEVVWHESHILRSAPVAGVLAIGLALAIPTVLPFVAAWAASSPRRSRFPWVVPPLLAGLVGVGVYPLCGIYLYCVLVGDCL